MIHNIVTDKNGNEHQAVFDRGGCTTCSLWGDGSCQGVYQRIGGAKCISKDRKDGQSVIYKRRIKIGDIKK